MYHETWGFEQLSRGLFVIFTCWFLDFGLTLYYGQPSIQHTHNYKTREKKTTENNGDSEHIVSQ